MSQRPSLVIYSSVNTPGKHDATGAFIPCAKACAKAWCDALLIGIDCVSQTKLQRQLDLEHQVQCRPEKFGKVGIFCHGTSSSLQLGYGKTNDSILQLVRILKPVIVPCVKVVLYACSTADGPVEYYDIGPATDGGFADRLRDMLCLDGFVDCVVYGHKVAGHTARNPYWVKFDGGGTSCDKQGGQWVVDYHSGEWDEWAAAIRDDNNNLRYTFMNS